MGRIARLMLVAALLISTVSALADPAALSDVPSADAVKTLALRLYMQMQEGQLDRTQLAPHTAPN